MSDQRCKQCNGQGQVSVEYPHRGQFVIECVLCGGTGSAGVRLDQIGVLWNQLTESQRVDLVMTAQAMSERRKWSIKS